MVVRLVEAMKSSRTVPQTVDAIPRPIVRTAVRVFCRSRNATRPFLSGPPCRVKLTQAVLPGHKHVDRYPEQQGQQPTPEPADRLFRDGALIISVFIAKLSGLKDIRAESVRFGPDNKEIIAVLFGYNFRSLISRRSTAVFTRSNSKLFVSPTGTITRSTTPA